MHTSLLYIKTVLTIFLLPFVNIAISQIPDTTRLIPASRSGSAGRDSSTIENITVTAFQTNSKWAEVPAAVSVLNEKQLQLVSPTSLVPGLNLVPGVRMEERSPGSYRLSIRGSLLRSPFGVRNIKIYWDDIPFTDAGGNTYLQLADVSQVRSIEIIKGPASSLYGANTGGALILHPTTNSSHLKNNLQLTLQGGSFGSFHEALKWEYNGKKFNSALQQSHTNSDGYRRQSELRRDAVSWNGSIKTGSSKLSFIASYTDLYYQTPGGINLSQFNADPRQARQATLTLPGAEEQKASIRNKTVFAGISQEAKMSEHLDNISTVMMSHTDFINPFITNYEIRNEWNYGGRSTFRYHTEGNNFSLQWLAGGEFQQNDTRLDNYRNNKGTKDTVLFRDKIVASQSFLFTQLTLNLFRKLIIQAGASSNKQLYKYKRLTNPLHTDYLKTQQRSLFTPRVSLLYKIQNISLYGVAARGFSPPTLAEIRPSDGNYYPYLQAETGWNYEAGVKGAAWDNRFLFDVSAYHFRLRDAIVRRLNTAGDEYFVNAGSTTQEGIEAWAKGYIVRNSDKFLSAVSLSHSASYQPYYFDDYMSGSTDLSGKHLTGVPRTIHVSTAEIQLRPGFFTNVVYNSTSRIPLNDMNDEWAGRYKLLQTKLGYAFMKKKWKTTFYVGADNILNEKYSLGNDINAAGRRYYNGAAEKNYFAGVSIEFR